MTIAARRSMIDFVMHARLDTVPDDVLADARRSLMDSIACQVAGAAVEPVRRLARARVGGSSPVLGLPQRVPAPAAAFVGGVAATWHDLDSGHRHPSDDPPVPGGHTPVHVIPVLLALGEPRGMGGEAFFRAYLVTYEFGARLAVASALRDGLHTHGVHATVAAAAAAVLATGGDRDLLERAIDLGAGLNVMPSMRTPLEGGTVRNAFAGVGAMHGVLAERLARSGVTPEAASMTSVYRGIAAGGFDAEALVEGLGSHWETALGYYKVHACCRWNHPALDALEELRGRRDLDPDAIEDIRVRTFAFAAQMDDRDPSSDLGAKFSLPWSIASYLVLGSTGPVGYTVEALADDRIRRLARRVEVVEEPAYSAQLPARRPTTVEVRLADGELEAASVLGSLGDPGNRFPDERMDEKYLELVGDVVGADAARRSHEMLAAIETVGDIGSLVAELRTTR
ncbi:MAG: MmgE/PrpD family protein [Acidimicrobiia bacterium]|nr:MmgE/PrpD family protein [Acidimicrobiia bacterium]